MRNQFQHEKEGSGQMLFYFMSSSNTFLFFKYRSLSINWHGTLNSTDLFILNFSPAYFNISAKELFCGRVPLYYLYDDPIIYSHFYPFPLKS